MIKALIRYKHGTPPHSVMTGTVEELKAEMSNRFDVMEHNGFYFDKKNPHKSPALRGLFNGPFPTHDYYMIFDIDKWQNKLDKTKLPETLVPNDGTKKWGGGAWCIVFVYSNKGNFVLKGYSHEINLKLKEMDLKYFANFCRWNAGQHRDHWVINTPHIYINEPDKSNKFKWTITKFGRTSEERKELRFKRLPKRWIPEIEELTHE